VSEKNQKNLFLSENILSSKNAKYGAKNTLSCGNLKTKLQF